MGHALDCPCAGSDECVFARFVALAAEGAREEAVLIATLIVRADVALGLTALAESVGLCADARSGAPADPVAAGGQPRRGGAAR